MTKGSALFIGVLVLIGCGLIAISGRSNQGVKSVKAGDWQEFVGVEYQVPKGTTIERSTIPGEVKVTLTKTSPRTLKVELIRDSHEIAFAGMKHVVEKENMGTNVEGGPEPWGWDMTYNATGSGIQHEHFDSKVVEHKSFRCVWNEATTSDRLAADAICRSLRAPPPDPDAKPTTSPSALAAPSGSALVPFVPKNPTRLH